MKPHIQRYRYRKSRHVDWGWAAYLPDSDGKIVILRVSKKFEHLQTWLRLNQGRYEEKLSHAA